MSRCLCKFCSQEAILYDTSLASRVLSLLLVFVSAVDTLGEGLEGMKVDNTKPQKSVSSNPWLRCGRHGFRTTMTMPTSCRKSSMRHWRNCTFLTRYRAHRLYTGTRSFYRCQGRNLFCSVQLEFLCVLLRIWCPLRLQPGVHCLWPLRRSITRDLLCRRAL